MKVLHVSLRDSEEGAARAAYRIHCAQVAAGIDSRMRVLVSGTGDERVTSGFSPSLAVHLKWKLHHFFLHFAQRGWQTENSVQHSFGHKSSGLVNELNSSDADILNLHWIPGMLSVKDIGLLRKPIVWTLHDMWAFCGGEHYTPDDSNARFRNGYQVGNRLPGEHGPDLNRKVWESKRREWVRQRFTIVGPSRWLTDCVRQSALFANTFVHHIPNTLNIEALWKPLPRDAARKVLGLPLDKKLILMGAPGGIADPRKGGDLLREAMKQVIAHRSETAELMIFGQAKPDNHDEWPCQVSWLGDVRDDRILVQAYSAADVMIVPSRQEAFGQTALESLACGTPVVAFDVGGLSDVIEHRKTGYLARPFETLDLVEGINWILQDEQRRQELAGNARSSAVCKFSGPVVAEAYGALYEDTLTHHITP